MYQYIRCCLKAMLQTYANLLHLTNAYQTYRVHIKHAYSSKFSAHGNMHRQRKWCDRVQVYRQIYPKMGFRCEPSIDIDSM